MKRFHIIAMTGLAAVVLATAASGQTARSPGASPGAQQMQQLQQLASERTALQAENARLRADLEQARKERDALRQSQQQAQLQAQRRGSR